MGHLRIWREILSVNPLVNLAFCTLKSLVRLGSSRTDFKKVQSAFRYLEAKLPTSSNIAQSHRSKTVFSHVSQEIMTLLDRVAIQDHSLGQNGSPT